MGNTWTLLGSDGKNRNLQEHPELKGYYCTFCKKDMSPDEFIPPPSASPSQEYHSSSIFGDAAGRDVNKSSKGKMWAIIASILGGIIVWLITLVIS